MNNLLKIFNPTKSRVIKERLIRNERYTTNGLWCIRSLYEPKFMAELKDFPALPESYQPKINELMEKVEVEEKEKLELTDNLRVIGNTCAIELTGKGFSVYINVYFICLFLKQPKYIHPEFYGNLASHHIAVYNGKDLMGVVMPINIV